MAIRVLIADDHAMLRESLRMVLAAQPDIEVVGEAEDGRDAVDEAQRLKPDILIMDIAMPGLNGIDGSVAAREACPTTKVIILSMHATSEHVYRALEAGAAGYVLKESATEDLIDAVRRVHVGRRYLSAQIEGLALRKYLDPRTDVSGSSPLASLSARERQVLQLVVEGHTSKEIAKRIHLSPKTVATYRSRLMAKLNVHDLSGLTKLAVEHGLTPSA